MIKTIGSQLFLFDGTELIKVGCVTSFGELPAQRDNQSTTALGDEFTSVTHTTVSLGQVQISVNFDSQSYEHNKIRAFFLSVTPLTAFIGLSETNEQPTVSGGLVDTPPGRTWISFKCRVFSYPMTLPPDSVVGLSFNLQVDSMPEISFAGGRQWNGDIPWNGGLLWQ